MSALPAQGGERCSLFVSEGRAVRFAAPVAETLHFDDVIVVRTDPPPGARDNENVFGVARSGDVRWRLEPIR